MGYYLVGWNGLRAALEFGAASFEAANAKGEADIEGAARHYADAFDHLGKAFVAWLLVRIQTREPGAGARSSSADEAGESAAIQKPSVEGRKPSPPRRPQIRLSIDPKIESQLEARGWTEAEIRDLARGAPAGASSDLRSAAKTIDGLPRSDPASVYGSRSAYIVVNDRTGEIVQISDKLATDWIPDSRIKWK